MLISVLLLPAYLVGMVPGQEITARSITGHCTEIDEILGGPDRESAILVRDKINQDNPWDVLHNVAGWTTRRLWGYRKYIRQDRSTISRGLYIFLLAFNQEPDGIAEDVNSVWTRFQLQSAAHTTDSCVTMIIWYNAAFLNSVGVSLSEFGRTRIVPAHRVSLYSGFDQIVRADILYAASSAALITRTPAAYHDRFARLMDVGEGENFQETGYIEYSRQFWGKVINPSPLVVPTSTGFAHSHSRLFVIMQTVVAAAFKGAFDQEPVSYKGLCRMFPNKSDWYHARKATENLLTTIAPKLSIFLELVDLNEKGGSPTTVALQRWYNVVVLQNAGRTYGEIGIAIVVSSGHFHVMPSPEVVRQLLKLAYPNWVQGGL